jgi:hypothetical protein
MDITLLLVVMAVELAKTPLLAYNAGLIST